MFASKTKSPASSGLFVFVNKTEPLNIDITPLPQMRPLSVDNLKGFFTAGTKPKVSEGLAKILGVDND